MARRAGIQLATSAIVRNSNGAAANEAASIELRRYRTPRRRREAPTESTTGRQAHEYGVKTSPHHDRQNVTFPPHIAPKDHDEALLIFRGLGI